MGFIGRSLSGVARGQRALLEADDAVGDVRGVRVDRRQGNVNSEKRTAEV